MTGATGATRAVRESKISELNLFNPELRSRCVVKDGSCLTPHESLDGEGPDELPEFPFLTKKNRNRASMQNANTRTTHSRTNGARPCDPLRIQVSARFIPSGSY